MSTIAKRPIPRKILALTLLLMLVCSTFYFVPTKSAHADGTSLWPSNVGSIVGNELITAPDGSVLVSNCSSDLSKPAAEMFAANGSATFDITQSDSYYTYLCDGGGKAIDSNGASYGVLTDKATGLHSWLAGYSTTGAALWSPIALTYSCYGNTADLTPLQMLMGANGDVYALAQDYRNRCNNSMYLIQVNPTDAQLTVTQLGSQPIDWLGAYTDGIILHEPQDLRYIHYDGTELPSVDTSEVSGGRVLTSTMDGKVFIETFANSSGVCASGHSQYTVHFEAYSPSGLAFRFSIPACWKVDSASATPSDGVAIMAYDDTNSEQLMSFTPNGNDYTVHQLALPQTQDYRSFTSPTGAPSYALVKTDTNGNILLGRQYNWQSNGGTYVGWQFSLWDSGLSLIDEFDTNGLDAQQGNTQNFSTDAYWSFAHGNLYLMVDHCSGADMYGCRNGNSRFLFGVPMLNLGMPYPQGALLGVNSATFSCPSIQFVGVRGSGELYAGNDGLGVVVDNVKNQLVANGVTNMGVEAIAYPAVPVLYDGLTSYPSDYAASVMQGENALTNFFDTFSAHCASTHIILVGYSQGAQIAADVAYALPSAIQNQIVALVLFGDPLFNPTQSAINKGTYDNTTYGVWVTIGGLPAHQAPSNFVGKTASYCISGDPICNDDALQHNLANCQANESTCPHLEYPGDWTTDAATWILNEL